MLTDNSDDGDEPTTDDTPAGDTPTGASHTESGETTTLAPSERRGGTRCCPWCLAAETTFEYHDDGHARCGYCDAAIPVGTDWYERGEKIVV